MTEPSHLPYGGIATFARAPIVHPGSDWRAFAAVLGIPSDIALGFRPGARFAPRALRDASLRYVPPFSGLDGRVRLDPAQYPDPLMVDAGDVVLPSLEPELARGRITAAARLIKERCRMPIFLGGDHSVTYPLLRAFRDIPELHVIQLDAHLDFTDTRNDTRYSNSSPFRRAVGDLPNLVHITTFGLRGLRFDAEAVAAARARGHTLVPMEQVEAHFQDILSALPAHRPVYLSIDVDAFDPAVLPGTSSPEPDGFTYALAMRLIREIVRRHGVVALDVVELAPNLDPTGRSELLAARLIMETLAEVFDAEVFDARE
ncbi:agmatinase [Deinococcus sp. Arct2-2]|uniref:arginase family protein n=1 Tax=Deinococcus sp. Arct2-2 TaxID=2568653 RepID=UPI0010A33DDA|nr:arginase family protein [Deinococcus sp. Arct2-2]THF68706.1 agmatinase [Deinococcus sp. Arct2-2]